MLIVADLVSLKWAWFSERQILIPLQVLLTHDCGPTYEHSSMKSESVNIGPSNGSPLAQKNHTSGQTHTRCDEQDVVTGEGKKGCFKRNCFQRVSGGIVWCLETLFYK